MNPTESKEANRKKCKCGKHKLEFEDSWYYEEGFKNLYCMFKYLDNRLRKLEKKK